MRLAILLVLAATSHAVAGPEPDLDQLACGGPTMDEYGAGLSKTWVRAVPSRPSIYFHRGDDETGPFPSFVDEDGRPVAFVPVSTGIPEYPLRFDLAIGAGVVTNISRDPVRYEVAPGMTPHTRAVKVDHWNGYFVIDVDSDAALLRYEHAGKTWFEPNWPPHFVRYFDGEDVRITAYYADRNEQVIFDRSVPRRPVAGELAAAFVALLVLAL